MREEQFEALARARRRRERRITPLVGREVLEELRWELTRREKAMEVSWP